MPPEPPPYPPLIPPSKTTPSEAGGATRQTSKPLKISGKNFTIPYNVLNSLSISNLQKNKNLKISGKKFHNYKKQLRYKNNKKNTIIIIAFSNLLRLLNFTIYTPRQVMHNLKEHPLSIVLFLKQYVDNMFVFLIH